MKAMDRQALLLGCIPAVCLLLAPPFASGAWADTQFAYIADSNGKIYQLDVAGSNAGSLSLPTASLQGILGIAAENAQSFLVSSTTQNAILRADPVNGIVSTVSSANLMQHPEGIVLVGSLLYVADPVANAIVSVNTTTGAQHIVSRDALVTGATWLCADASGFLYVSCNATSLIARVNRFTGAQVLISSGGMLSGAGGIGLGPDGQLYVACATFNRVLRVNPKTGAQAVVSGDNHLVSPTGLGIGPEGYLFVTCAGSNQVVRVHPATGAQTVYLVSDMTEPGGVIALGTPGTIFPPPPPPVSCSATDDRPDSVIFQWVPGSGHAESFQIMRDGILLASLDTSVTRYADKPASGPHTYCVSAVNAIGTSDACCDAGQISLSAVAPHLDFVRDVPNDQGGKVMLGWTASSFDGFPKQVTSYRVWRRVPGADSWEALADLPAGHLTGYGTTAATPQDSLPGSNPFTAFFVRALTANPDVYYDSNADSGYSVDNLAPDVPQGIQGAYVMAGGIRIQWQRSQAADVAAYRVYRGATPGFVPSEVNRLASTADTTFIDRSADATFYKLSAVDVHGNESGFASVSVAPNGALSTTVMLAPQPNPSTSGVDFGYTVGSDQGSAGSVPVRLVLFDTRGKLVRVLESGAEPVGQYHVQWNGLDEHGARVGTGVYQYKLQVGTQVRSGKVIRI